MADDAVHTTLLPEHIRLIPVIVGAGNAVLRIVLVAVPVQDPSVTVQVYVPAATVTVLVVADVLHKYDV